MNTKLISKTLASTALARSSLMMLSGTPAQAAPTREEIDEVNQAVALKESGYTFPAIEEALKVRREATVRAEAEKSAKGEAAVADAKRNRTGAMN
jgi:hypothetical protein